MTVLLSYKMVLCTVMNNESTRFRLRPATPLDAVAIAAVWARSIRE